MAYQSFACMRCESEVDQFTDSVCMNCKSNLDSSDSLKERTFYSSIEYCTFCHRPGGLVLSKANLRRTVTITIWSGIHIVREEEYSVYKCSHCNTVQEIINYSFSQHIYTQYYKDCFGVNLL